MDDIKEIVIKIVQECKPEFDQELVDPNYDFITSGALDSFDIILITAKIEEVLGKTIPGTEITSTNFKSINSIVKLVDEL